MAVQHHVRNPIAIGVGMPQENRDRPASGSAAQHHGRLQEAREIAPPVMLQDRATHTYAGVARRALRDFGTYRTGVASSCA